MPQAWLAIASKLPSSEWMLRSWLIHSQFARSVLFSCGGELCEPLKEANKRVKGLRSEVWLHTKQGSDCQAAVDIIFTARERVVSSARPLFCGKTVIARSARHEFVFCCKCSTCRRGWCGSRGSCGCCCGQGQAGDRAARARNGGIREDIVRAAAQRAPSHGKEAVLSHQPRPCCELTSMSCSLLLQLHSLNTRKLHTALALFVEVEVVTAASVGAFALYVYCTHTWKKQLLPSCEIGCDDHFLPHSLFVTGFDVAG